MKKGNHIQDSKTLAIEFGRAAAERDKSQQAAREARRAFNAARRDVRIREADCQALANKLREALRREAEESPT